MSPVTQRCLSVFAAKATVVMVTSASNLDVTSAVTFTLEDHTMALCPDNYMMVYKWAPWGPGHSTPRVIIPGDVAI